MAHVTFSETPTPAEFQALFSALDHETAAIAGPLTLRQFALLLRDGGDGAVIGGLWAHTGYSWLTIDLLFVPAPLRRHGIGAALVCRAEEIARRRGCVGAYVAAFDFQAPRFYQRLGYAIFAVHEDLPPRHNHLHLSKRL